MQRIQLKSFLEMGLLNKQKFQIMEQQYNGTTKILVENKKIAQILKMESIVKRTVSCWLIQQGSGNAGMWIFVYPEGVTTPEELIKHSIQKD